MGFTPDDYDAEADLIETGMVTCDDCGTRVRTTSLVSLPVHNCADRRRQNEQIRILDAGQPVSSKTAWIPERFRTERGQEG